MFAGTVLGDDLEEHLTEAEERVGRLPGLRGDGFGQREEGAKRQAAAVEQEEPVVEARVGHAAILRHTVEAPLAPGSGGGATGASPSGRGPVAARSPPTPVARHDRCFTSSTLVPRGPHEYWTASASARMKWMPRPLVAAGGGAQIGDVSIPPPLSTTSTATSSS